MVIFGNDVAKFDFRIPNLLNLLEFPPDATGRFSRANKFSPDDSGTSGLYLSLQGPLCLNPVEHPFAIRENSTLCRDWNFVLILRQVSWRSNLSIWGSEYPRAFRRNRIVHRWRTCRDRNGQFHRRWPGFRHNPVIFFLFLHPLSHRSGAAGQAEILGTAEPFVSISGIWCLVSMYLIWIKVRVQVDSVKNPIKSNSVGSWHMSHCRTSPLCDHLDHCFVVFKDIQHGGRLRKFNVRKQFVNVKQNRTVVLGWNFGLVLGVLACCGMKQQVPLCK